ncbi:MAG: hypothetical protein ACI4Q3_03905 [Kiritimatiellia bacterium]
MRQFGRRLAIGENAFVTVDVPAAAGTYDVLTLEAELSEAELARVMPETWVLGWSYTMSQRTENGATTVSCTVAEGGPAERTVETATAFADKQLLAGRLTVAAGVAVAFQAPVVVVGTELVIDVAAGAVVTFERPLMGTCTAVRKIGAGRVVFSSPNPGFMGSWTQDGGVFDIRDAAFGSAATGLAFTRDTLSYTGDEPGVIAAPVAVNGGSAQSRVVARVERDLVCAGGWNSTGGGLVKTGAGTLSIIEPAGAFALNTGSVAADDPALSDVPADGTAPADANAVKNGVTAGAALQILSGAVRIAGAGRTATTVGNEQAIYVGTSFAGQTAQAGLEIADCTYRADGTVRATVLAAGCANADFAAPYLSLLRTDFVSHRMALGSGSPAIDVRPTVRVTDSTIAFESGFNVGMSSDRVHPVLTLDGSRVTQWRDGYALGHVFYRDFDVTLTNGSLLAAAYSTKAGANWHGFRFASDAWGTLRVTAGSKILTSRIEMLNADATEARHVDWIFDGGTLELTNDTSGVAARTAFARPEIQGFTSAGAGMVVRLGEGIEHAFATPFRGAGAVTKTGAGTMRLEAVADGGPVFRGPGDVFVAEGTVDLGGLTETVACFAGAGGVVCNGTCALKGRVDAATLLTLGDATQVGRVEIAPAETEFADGQTFAVARIAAGATVGVAAGCRVTTADPAFRGVAAVDGSRVVVTLQSRKRFFIFVR